MSKSTGYKAFISYSHEDIRLAKWIQRKLERYLLPSGLAAAKKIPRRALHPLFRDEDEMAASTDLSQEIRDGLVQSENLIVICSPAAAESYWVNEEIKAFQELGKGHRIFCLIVAGAPEPGADCCFPLSITEGSVDPLAADVRPGNDRTVAVIKLVAALLDLRFDDLRQRDVLQRRRDWLIRTCAAFVSVVIVVGATVLVSTTPPCQSSNERLIGVWDADARQETQTAFLATGVSYGPGSLQRVFAELDRYAASWIDTHRDACEATLVREEQSEALMDLRMDCLESRRQDLAAVSDLFRSADANLVEHSVLLARNLPALSRCSDREALSAAFPLPEDPQIQTQISDMRGKVAFLRVEVQAGLGDTAIDEIAGILRLTESLDYPPISAEVLLLLGNSQVASGLVDDAESSFYQAASAATRAGDDRKLVQAWIEIITLKIDFQGELEEAGRLLEMADAQLSRIKGAPDLEAAVASGRGHLMLRSNDYGAARDAFSKAVDIADRYELSNRSLYLENLVAAMTDLLELARADLLAKDLHNTIVAEFGPAHPRTADVLWSMARIAQRQMNYGRSKTLSRNSIDIFQSAYGSDHPLLANLYQGLAWDLKSLGEFDAAHEALENSLSIYTARPDDVEFFVPAAVYNTRGDLYVSQGLDDSARDAFESAIKLWESNQPGHGGVAVPLTNLGMLENRQGRNDFALNSCLKAFKMDEMSWGTNHPNLGWSLVCIADGQIGTGDWTGADRTLTQTEKVLGLDQADQYLKAEAQFLRALVLWEAGEQGEAKRLANEARDGLADADPSFGYRRKQLADWLASH